jgi:spermidine synthase
MNLESSSPATHPDEWVIDSNGEFAIALKYQGKALFHEKSPYQTVEVFETKEFGKLLTIDRMVMCTERDEAAYHETIVHPAMLTHPGINNVLVIGAGDGGTIRELMRHPQIEKVTMVEIDDAVVRASKQFLPTISTAFDHPKLDLHIDDGIKFVSDAPDNSYDLIIVDSSDPVGPSEGLFSESFYRDVYRCLKPGGVITVQSEAPVFNTSAFVDLNHCLKRVFGVDRVHPMLLFIPTYPTGLWSITHCSKNGPNPIEDFDRDRVEAFTQAHPLRYYNADVHQAAFCLPTYIRELIGN